MNIVSTARIFVLVLLFALIATPAGIALPSPAALAAGTNIDLYEFVCPSGFEPDQIDDHAEVCQSNPRAGVTMNASGPGDRFIEATTDAHGLADFEGYTEPGEVTIAEREPTGEFVDHVVGCHLTDTGDPVPVDDRGNGRAAFAIELDETTVAGGAGIRCDWYNIPAATQSTPVSAPTLSIDPERGTGGDVITYAGSGYTPGGEVSVLVTGDGLIVDDMFADESGEISGRFAAPDRDRLTGESSNAIPVFAIDQASGLESNRASFTYVTALPKSTPTPTPTPVGGRPVHIHHGTCESLDAQPRDDLTALAAPDTTAFGEGRATVGEASFSVVDVPLEELLSDNYAINAHPSYEQMRPFVACGEIGGTPRDDGSIVIGLREQNGSGLTGIAVLRPDPTDPGRTQVSVFLAPGLAGEDPTLQPAAPDAVLIRSVVTNGPVSPEYQEGYEITIYGDGRVEIVVRPRGASPALPEDERTADVETRTVTLSPDELRDLLETLRDLGFFQLTQQDEIDPDDVLVGDQTSNLTVNLLDGTWQVDGNGLSSGEQAVLDAAQRAIAEVVELNGSFS